MRLSNGDVLLAWPLKEHVINQGWLYSDGSQHNGIDLKAALETPVYASEDGVVKTIQCWDGHTTNPQKMQSYGNMIDIVHNDYQGESLKTRYAHLSGFNTILGSKVKEGDIIGYSGATGNVTGPHLHFEVLWGGRRTNPLYWLDNDFKKANNSVLLGNYTSVERPASQEQTQYVFLIGLADSDVKYVQELSNQLYVKCEFRCDNKIAILPKLSNGDAYKYMVWARLKNIAYYSEYNKE